MNENRKKCINITDAVAVYSKQHLYADMRTCQRVCVCVCMHSTPKCIHLRQWWTGTRVTVTSTQLMNILTSLFTSAWSLFLSHTHTRQKTNIHSEHAQRKAWFSTHLNQLFFSFLQIHKQNKLTKKKPHRPNEFLSPLLTNVCIVVNWERNAAHWGDLVLKHKTHTQKWISWFIHKSSSSGYCYLFFCPTPSVSRCFPNVRLYVRWNHPFKLCVCMCVFQCCGKKSSKGSDFLPLLNKTSH